jgi:predicted hotdog family 3-hydroxylacyl-ACP dehydratase
MLIDRSGIARLIPHQGAMCLLDAVLSWDDRRIRCAATSHRAPDNPLRRVGGHALGRGNGRTGEGDMARHGGLGILCGVEYAAQAMAVHVALTAGETEAPARVGYLASLRALECHTGRLDLLAGTLIVEAERLHGEPTQAVYGFTLRHQDRAVLAGRAAVMLR